MTADRLGGNDADWLLAQLAAGSSPAPTPPLQQTQPTPPAQPSYANPPAAPAAAPPAQGRRAARSEESLDWFSLAETPAREDTATRALPVVDAASARPAAPGAPAAAPAVPPAQSPMSAPGSPSPWGPPQTHVMPVAPPAQTVPVTPAAPAAPPASPQPWASAQTHAVPVMPPATQYSVPASSHSPLTVEPPVGRPAGGHAPAGQFPTAGAAQPVIGQAAPTVPGPATPTGPFALTWGETPSAAAAPSSEDALREAFRRLSQPDAAPVHPPQAAQTQAAPLPQVQPAPIPPAVDDVDPFGGFVSPPVARSSFTSVAPNTATQAPTSDFGADLWSALQEPDPVPAPELTRRERKALEQQAALADADPAPAPAPVPSTHSASPLPAPWPSTSGVDAAPAVPEAASAPIWAPAASAAPAAPVAPAPVDGAPAVPAPRSPFPAFAAAPAPQAPVDQRVEPVDDLLAALGGSRAPEAPVQAPHPHERAEAQPESNPFGRPYDEAAPQTSRFASFAAGTVGGQTIAPAAFASAPSAPAQGFVPTPAAAPSPAPAPSFTPAPSLDDVDGLADLGLSFDDSDADTETEVVPQYAQAARAWSAVPVDPSETSVVADEDEEPVFDWGITPDPLAEDPRADAPAGSVLAMLAASAATGTAAAGPAASPFASTGAAAPAGVAPIDELAPFAAFEGEEPSTQTQLLHTAPLPVGADENDPYDADPFPRDPFDVESFHDEPVPTRQFAQPATERIPQADAWAAAGSADEPEHDDPFASLFEPTGPVAVAPVGGVAAFAMAGSPAGATGAAGAAGAGYASSGPFAAAGGYGSGTAFSAASGTSTPSAGGGRPAGAGRSGGSGGYGGGGNGGGSGSSGKGGSDGSGGERRTVKTLVWVAGGLVAVLVLVGLFFFGSKLAGGGSADAGASQSSSASASDESTPAVEPTAPQPMGVHAWNTLYGGECLDPFENAWKDEYTVVDCGVAHAAQLVYRGELPGDEAAPFPGEAELGPQMDALCTAAGIVDVAAAAGIPDLQVQGSYPVTEDQWAEGERTYYCFVNRSGGEPLTGSLAGPGPAA